MIRMDLDTLQKEDGTDIIYGWMLRMKKPIF